MHTAAFPELESQRDFIEKMVRLEEESVWRGTMTVGLNKLEELLTSTKGAMPSSENLVACMTHLAPTRALIRVGLEGAVLQSMKNNLAKLRCRPAGLPAVRSNLKVGKPKQIRSTQAREQAPDNLSLKAMRQRGLRIQGRCADQVSESD